MSSISPPTIWLYLKWMEEDGNKSFVRPNIHRKDLVKRFLAFVKDELPDHTDEAGNHYYQVDLLERIWNKVNM